MLKHYFLSSVRNLKRNKLYAFINTLGLALGLAISFVIFSWVNVEVNYDTFHRDHARIFRIVNPFEDGGYARTPPAIQTAVLNQIPEIAYSTRIFNTGQFGRKNKITVGEQIFTDEEVVYVDTNFFDVFSFPLLEGNAKDILHAPSSIILTETTAQKFFGESKAMGQTIMLADRRFEVAGIMKDIPTQSHFHFDMLLPMSSHPWGRAQLEDCGLGSCWRFYTYIKLNATTSSTEALEKINQTTNKILAAEYDDYTIDLGLQPITDIHLRSTMDGEIEANGDIRYVYLFSTIALLVIIIASINYINLATAYSMSRTKEVGIKKTLGALRNQLFLQYLTESILIAGVAGIAALFLIEFTQPLISSLTGYHFGNVRVGSNLIMALAGMALITGLLSGIAPSSLMASMQPILAMKAKGGNADQKGRLRKGLVVFQFCISQVLLISTAIIYQQLRFVQETKLGYDKEHVLVLYTGYSGFHFDALKESLLANPSVIAATGVSSLPTNIETDEGIDTPDGEEHWASFIVVDKHFFATMGIDLKQGKTLVENLTPQHYENKYVLNQAALKEIGWSEDEALTQTLVIRHGNMKPGPVIGVIDDFHFQSLHFPIAPLVVEFEHGNHQYMLLKIQGEQLHETIEYAQGQWEEVIGNVPFEYQFLDEEYNKLYQSESRIGKLIILFAILATLIAMLGLFGLASYASFKRIKEIGIRKVFGATPSNIIMMLSGGFTKLIILSFIIAAPLTYLLMQVWLQEFAYKTSVNPLLIVAAGLLVLLLTLLSVGYHSIRASNTNPVDTLRSD